MLGVQTALPGELNYLGLFFLFKIFETKFCHLPYQETIDAFSFQLDAKPNDFSDIPEYYVRLAIITALSFVRDPRGQPFPIILRFLVNLLTYNDNSQNPVSER